LFGQGRRERHTFFVRASLVLQDMAQGEAEAGRRRAIGQVLSSFDEAAHKVQEEMSAAMAGLEADDSSLLWGDSADRRLYYYKMGVTNSLRRSGVLDSLRHLYRFQGVDYDVVEAYGLASRECPLLDRAEMLGVEHLLTMGPSDVRALVQGTLPR
jgi:hypothetical protein